MRARRVPRPHEPRDGEQRRLLRDLHPVGAAAQQRVELAEAPLGQAVGEDRGTAPGHPGTTREQALGHVERPARRGRTGRKAAADDLGRHPRREVGDGRAGADPQAAARHPVEDRAPAVHAPFGALARLRIVVGERGDERLRQLAERVAGAHPRVLIVVCHGMPAWRVLPPRPPGPSPVLCC